MTKKNIIVTGGAGFIGSNLCEKLLSSGNDYIICLDNLFTGSEDNITHLSDNNNFEFVKHDIINPYFTDRHIDQVYNLACPASPEHYQFNAIRTIKANTIGVINMLGLAKKHKARILQASTSEIYGDPLEHPQKEDYRGNVNPIGPRACYDEGKRAAEALFMDYARHRGTDIKIVRIFNAYGPYMKDDGRIMSNFIQQALKGESITIYGDGSQTRSFIYIDDLVEGIMRMMRKDDFMGPVNLGNPEEYTVKQIAETVVRLTNSKSA